MGLLWVGAIVVCPVFHNPSFSLTQVTQFAVFPLLWFFILAEPTLVGRVRGTWWLASLGAIVTAIQLYLFLVVVVYRIPCLWEFYSSICLSPESLLSSSGVEENRRPRTTRGEYVIFCSKTLV